MYTLERLPLNAQKLGDGCIYLEALCERLSSVRSDVVVIEAIE